MVESSSWIGKSLERSGVDIGKESSFQVQFTFQEDLRGFGGRFRFPGNSSRNPTTYYERAPESSPLSAVRSRYMSRFPTIPSNITRS